MPGEDLQYHLAAAERAHAEGRADDVGRHFEAALALDPRNPDANNWLGAAALAAGDAARAAAHFEAASEAEPGERSHWLNLAAALRLRGETDGECAALEAALDLDQTDLLALIRIAELHERLGEQRQAADYWTRVGAAGSAIADPSPEFAEILRHAADVVSRQRQIRATAMEQALTGDLAAATPRDRRRMQRAAEAWLGLKPVYFNRCEGLHYPFLPADEFFDRELFPWLSKLEAATPIIVEELQAILADPGTALEPYISLPRGLPDNKWSPLDRSLDWGAFHLWKEGERFDAACARVPRTAELIEALPMCVIPGRAPNIFLSILRAGTHIPPHTGVTNVRSVIHLPLIVPADCGFRVGGEVRAWEIGTAFAFDDTIEHEAWNRSDRDRAVLILDAWNPYLSDDERAMVCKLYAAADAGGPSFSD